MDTILTLDIGNSDMVAVLYDLDGNLIEVRTLAQKNSENSKDENK